MQSILRDILPVKARAVAFWFGRIFSVDRSSILSLGVLGNSDRLALLRLFNLRRLFGLRRLFAVLRDCRKTPSKCQHENKCSLAYHRMTPLLNVVFTNS